MLNRGIIFFLLSSTIILFAGLARADEHALFSTRSLTPEIALKAARAALQKCRDEGYQVSVAVVDRMGVLQVLLRDRFAGPHTPDTARRKGWSAVSFRTNTTDLAAETQAGSVQSGARDITDILMLGGGMLIEAGGSLVGAIGVSGAPGGPADDLCAAAGIAAIEDDISF